MKRVEPTYSKFERTVNLMLSRITFMDGIQFDLYTDKVLREPMSKKKMIKKIEVKQRKSGKRS